MMSENKSIPQNLETEPFDRLKDEDLRALCQTEESIRQMSKYKDDYQVLQNTLKTLPDKYSYDILVPFGNKAFMPGKLVHTNEILVLLGDNWFVEKSAKDASQIVSRRMKVIENQIQDIEKQKQLLKSRVENLSEAEGAFEIKEAYDEEEEKKWREQHRENVRRNYREERRKEKEVSEDDKDVWDLLDKLEQNEQEKEELLEEGGYLSKDEEESDDIGHNSITFKHTRLTEQQRREVRTLTFYTVLRFAFGGIHRQRVAQALADVNNIYERSDAIAGRRSE
ncbi:DgyrCDS6062 [Dimorphilus gyrociliatus]|uniref:DgyrCDS6062 n=1 Tax=Dimorphilus gyrociliatus TaxID=2664684 RepID=A0A7I8VLV6_9ANNE|nr:DgyrCDS6062 [Dimorphilus gyrociliatus]